MASKYKKGQIAYEFVPLPKLILQSKEWQELPKSAIKLTLDLMAQYTGKNNGRLNASFEALKAQGWKSEHTLIKAKRDLLEASFAIHTRQGYPPNVSDWVGFTWWQLDFDRSMNIDPREFPYLNFMPLVPRSKTI